MRINSGMAFLVIGNIALGSWIFYAYTSAFRNVSHDNGTEWEVSGDLGERCFLSSTTGIDKPKDTEVVASWHGDRTLLRIYTTSGISDLPSIEDLQLLPSEASIEFLPEGTRVFEADITEQKDRSPIVYLKIVSGGVLRINNQRTGETLATFGGSDNEGKDALKNYSKCMRSLKGKSA